MVAQFRAPGHPTLFTINKYTYELVHSKIDIQRSRLWEINLYVPRNRTRGQLRLTQEICYKDIVTWGGSRLRITIHFPGLALSGSTLSTGTSCRLPIRRCEYLLYVHHVKIIICHQTISHKFISYVLWSSPSQRLILKIPLILFWLTKSISIETSFDFFFIIISYFLSLSSSSKLHAD